MPSLHEIPGSEYYFKAYRKGDRERDTFEIRQISKEKFCSLNGK